MTEGLADALVAGLENRGYEIMAPSMQGAEWRVARRSYRRLLTRIGVYVAVRSFPYLTVEMLRQYVEAAVEHAKGTHSGLPLGMQAGLLTLPVAVSADISDEVRIFIMESGPRRFAVLCRPIAMDTQRRETIYRTKATVWGFVYESLVKRVIQDDIIESADF